MSNNGKVFIDTFTQKTKKQYLLIILAIFLPLLIAAVTAALYGIQSGYFTLPTIKWNDEAAYYELVKTWLATGMPEGYWGYNGGHAILGTGGAWGYAILIPYVLFGLAFSWNIHSIFIANLVFLMLANLLFILLVVPEKRHLIRMILVQATSVILILYLSTSMSEILRYSIAIVLAGMFYRLFFGKYGVVTKYIVFPLVLLFSIQVYVFFVFCIPIYVFAIMRNQKVIWKLLVSVFSTAIVALGSYLLLHMISSAYNIGKTEQLLLSLQSFDFKGVFLAVWVMIYDGMYDLLTIFKAGMENGLYIWLTVFCTVLIFFPLLLYFFEKRKTSKLNDISKEKKHIGPDATIYLIISYSVTIYLSAYIMLYSMEKNTYFRGVGVVVIFAIHLLLLLKNKKCFLVFFAIYVSGVIFLPSNLDSFMESRYLSAEDKVKWIETEEELEQNLALIPDGTEWENTVALYTLEPRIIASIPEGFGVNLILDSSIFCEDAQYLIFSLKDDQDQLTLGWIETFYPTFYETFEQRLQQEYEIKLQTQEHVIWEKRLIN